MGHVFCIVVDTGSEVLTFGGADKSLEHGGYQINEYHAMLDFAAWARKQIPCRMIGHNSLGFDRPFLRARSIVLKEQLPVWMTRPLKPWDAVDSDTMLMWTGGQPGKTISLDRLCRALGLEGKRDGMDGSEVWDACKAGRHADVVAYCAADVARTRACWERMAEVLIQGGDDE
jgi:predicted PolB exonuclease-like 3'-5' exonuclease